MNRLSNVACPLSYYIIAFLIGYPFFISFSPYLIRFDFYVSDLLYLFAFPFLFFLSRSFLFPRFRFFFFCFLCKSPFFLLSLFDVLLLEVVE